MPIQLAKKLLEKSLEKPLEKPLEISYTGKTPKLGSLQGGAGGLAVGWVDLDLECSPILLGQ